jgi:DNA polymerase-1
MPQKLLIIDSNALFHRSRSALTRAMGEMMTSYGIPVTGTYGFLNALFAVMEQYKFDSVIPVYDQGGNWRKKEDENYKANRQGSDLAHRADMNLLIQDVLPLLGFTPIGSQGYEADDVIATIARNSSAYEEIYILTCDKDLLQLVNNRVRVILFNSSKKVELIDEDGVMRIFGVKPSEVKYYKALAGDSSDNVAGIPGVGPKTAVKIINESAPDEGFTVGDKICLHAKLREHAANFLANLRLVSLDDDVPNLRWFASSPPSHGSVLSIFTQLEFHSYLKDKRLGKILKALGVNREEAESVAAETLRKS